MWDQTPWYLVEFSRVSTSVDEQGAAPFVSVAPNPVYDGSFTVRHIGPAQQIEIIDMTGSIVRRQIATGEATRIQTLGLASGVYTVMVDGGRHGGGPGRYPVGRQSMNRYGRHVSSTLPA